MKSKSFLKILILICFGANGTSLLAEDPYIYIRLSFKIIRSINGDIPTGGCVDNSLTAEQNILANIDTCVSKMNKFMDSYQRGYRFVLTEKIFISSNVGTPGPSGWYDTNFFDQTMVTIFDNGVPKLIGAGIINKYTMESLAQTQPIYQWREDAINIYIQEGTPGGICSFPATDPGISNLDHDQEIIIVGSGLCSGYLLLHEIGHFFSLCHTQGCFCAQCDDTIGTACTVPGNDEITDNLPDLACWDEDQISMNSFGNNFQNINSGQQKLVLDTYKNLMSYHNFASNNPIRLTEKQLNKWADAAYWSFSRRDVRSGWTFFMSPNGDLNSGNSSLFPSKDITKVLTVSQNLEPPSPNTNMIYLESGIYWSVSQPNQPVIIDQRVTLRAIGGGSAFIQKQ
jgi:hypothetical protein